MLTEYQKEWPDVARGEALMRRREYSQLVEHVFGQLRPVLSAMQEAVERHSEQLMYSDLTQTIPDYDAVRDEVLAWVDTQPSFLKAAYQQVANNGSTDEVAELVNIWRKQTGAAAPTPAPVAAPVSTPTPAPAPLSPAAAAALQSLKPVPTSRSSTTAGPDPNDFDAAFAEFASRKD